MKNESILKNIYQNTSKHSNYQIIPSNLEKFLNNADIEVRSRHEKERLKYFLDNIKIESKNILDIGGNTGYFTFESLCSGAKHVDYYEGNKIHARFVKEALKVLQLKEKVDVYEDYFLFDKVKSEKIYDVVFLLNVLHHIGDDYGDALLSKEKALQSILDSLKNLADKTDFLVLQLGFNWKGNSMLPLFKDGTKKEMINFLQDGIKDYFDVVSIGIAEKDELGIIYNPVDECNIERNDALGEFLNRPIFILKSQLFKTDGMD
ncbi:MAG: class I SAM-dependent methyltransferase [Methyloprofundus sp.]|nr:class I SAM-dependent methyltransferase [Methyloprofundus sp.]